MQFFSNALGIGRAMVLCNNAELVPPLQSPTSSKRTCKAERARSLNLLWFLIYSLFIKSYRSELFLLLAIDITGFVENGFDLLRLCIKVIAQRFERVKFLVPEQHIDA